MMTDTEHQSNTVPQGTDPIASPPIGDILDAINNMLDTPNKTRYITDEEYVELLVGLQKYHSIFKKVVEVSHIKFVDTPAMPTACIYHRKGDGVPTIMINETFWKELSTTRRLWVITHECLHSLLGHCGVRSLGAKDHATANKMQDNIINQMTVEKFGFKRSEIDPENIFCWFDRYFDKSVPTHLPFEHYYMLMEQNPNGGNGVLPQGNGNGGEVMDIHIPSDPAAWEEFIEKMKSRMTPQEIEQMKKLEEKMNGSRSGTQIWDFSDLKVKKTKKWESVIKEWIAKKVAMLPKPQTNWYNTNRRNVLLPKDNFLPAEEEKDKNDFEKDKANLLFFLDVSGSCVEYAERFIKAAFSIPEDKFNVDLFCFDTEVHAVDRKKKELVGGGGTSFREIPETVARIAKERDVNENKFYVWILTDGYGDSIDPQIPKNWYWFLTEGSSKEYIHEKSHTYNLGDYQ